MRHTGPLLCLAASLAYAGSESGRPRGVGPEFAKFFKNRETFTCISNPSIKIPFSRVNDDFCDCPDGSDEPGTAACSYLSPLSPSSPADTSLTDKINSTLALPGFYCKNKGHRPAYVPYTAVDDGVCDYDLCCDGSEEFSGHVKCVDKCTEIGKAARKIAETKQKVLNEATRKKKELVTQAARLRKEIQDKIADMQVLVGAAEIKVANLKTQLEETEMRERNKVVKGAEGASGEVGMLVGQARERTKELRDTLIQVRGERDSSRALLSELEQLLTTFKEEYNPNFNDEGVKRAVRAWEDYAARDKGAGVNAAQDRDLDEIVKTDEEYGLDWDSFIKSADSSEDAELELLYSFEAYLPPFLRTWVDEQLRTLRQTLIDNGILAKPRDASSPSSSATESRAVTDARSALTSAETDLRSLTDKISSSRSDLDRDHGQDDVFRSLKDTCITTDSGEYTYELCWMVNTSQRSKKGGGSTGMGSFTRFDTIEVDDDEDKPDGKTLGKGTRLVMRYENGQHCWNGPNRSTAVVLACADRHEIWKITEEEKCVYRMEVGTPAVCGWTKGEDTAAATAGEDGAASAVWGAPDEGKDEL